MTTVAISGFQGKMGQSLCEAVWNDEAFNLGAITHRTSLQWDVEGLTPVTAEALDDVFEVLIDFTQPEAMIEHLKACVRLGKPIVIGTTGYTSAQQALIVQASAQIPVFLSANMSIGVAVLSELVKKASTLLKDYDIEIVEAHHKDKKDAPSGTALMLANEVCSARQVSLKDVAVTDRASNGAPREVGQIGFSSIRAGGLAGEHTVMLVSEDEQLTLTHRAHDRALFAKGALKAAHWLKTQSPGLYTMQDFLGIS